MLQEGLDRDTGLDCDVFDLLHHRLRGKAWFFVLQVLQNLSQGTLVPTVIVSSFVVHEAFRFLLNRVVRQMHKQIVEVALLRPDVLFSREPS